MHGGTLLSIYRTNRRKDSWIDIEPQNNQRRLLRLLAKNLRYLLHGIDVSSDAVVEASLILVAQGGAGVDEANVEALLLHGLGMMQIGGISPYLHDLLHVSLVELVADVGKSLLKLLGGIFRHGSVCSDIYVFGEGERIVVP